MRVAFAGSPEAAVPPLRALVGGGHEVIVAVTQPDRARAAARPAVAHAGGGGGRGAGHPGPAPRNDQRPEVVEEIADVGARALAVVAFGQILREAVLSRWPSINVHFSLLPAWSGAAPVERAIMGGATTPG